MRLTEGDAAGVLAHFDAEVQAEEAKVAHVKRLLHLRLERLHLCFISAGDDEAVDVDADQQDIASTAPKIGRAHV